MVELEDEQEREAQKQAVGCHGLHGLQYSPPTRHIIELQNPQTLTHPQNKRERGIAILLPIWISPSDNEYVCVKLRVGSLTGRTEVSVFQWARARRERDSSTLDSSLSFPLAPSLMNIKTKRITALSLSLCPPSISATKESAIKFRFSLLSRQSKSTSGVCLCVLWFGRSPPKRLFCPYIRWLIRRGKIKKVLDKINN